MTQQDDRKGLRHLLDEYIVIIYEDNINCITCSDRGKAQTHYLNLLTH